MDTSSGVYSLISSVQQFFSEQSDAKLKQVQRDLDVKKKQPLHCLRVLCEVTASSRDALCCRCSYKWRRRACPTLCCIKITWRPPTSFPFLSSCLTRLPLPVSARALCSSKPSPSCSTWVRSREAFSLNRLIFTFELFVVASNETLCDVLCYQYQIAALVFSHLRRQASDHSNNSNSSVSTVASDDVRLSSVELQTQQVALRLLYRVTYSRKLSTEMNHEELLAYLVDKMCV